MSRFPDNLSAARFADVIGPAGHTPETRATSINATIALLRTLLRAEQRDGLNVAECARLLAKLPQGFAMCIDDEVEAA